MFWGIFITFSMWLNHVTFLQTVYDGSNFSTALSTLFFFFFYDSHCNRYEVTAYDLHFSGDYVCWASFINLLTICVSWGNIYSSLVCYAKSLQSCPTFWDPMDCSPQGSSIHGILQARILESVAMPSSRGSSQSRVRNHVSYVPCIGRRVLYH